MSPEKKKKNILLLADWYEPGYKAGGPIQSSRNFVAAMQEAYSISVLTTSTDLGETTPYPGIPVNQWITRSPGIRIYYATRESLKRGLLQELIDKEDPDYIYLNSMYSFRFSIIPLFLLWRKKLKAQIVLSPRGMLRESAIKIKSTRKKVFLALINRLRIPEKIRFHATDPQEEKDIHHYFPRAARVEMVPNFSAGLPQSLSPIKKIPGQLRCVFISRIMPIKNILFFLKILNEIPASIELIFTIYGEVEDEKYWAQAQKTVSALPENIEVLYRGPLPHAEVLPSLEASHVFVLPTLGENFGHAIFEALSAGRPCLISDKTPWLGLEKEKIGWDLPLHDPKPWIAALTEAAGFDQSAFNERSENCRKYAKAHQERTDLKKAYINLFS
jgi:glycosyltransferase involved in cell wall biosynthesis